MGCEVTLRFAQEHTSVRSTLSPSAEINSGLRAVWGIWTGPGRWVIRVRRRVLKVLQCDNQSAVTTLLSQLWGLFLCHSDENRPWWVPYIKQHFPSFLKHINNTAVFFSHSPSTPFLLSLHCCFSSLWHSHTSSLSHLSASIPLSVLPLLTVHHPLPILLTPEFVAALRYWSVESLCSPGSWQAPWFWVIIQLWKYPGGVHLRCRGPVSWPCVMAETFH